MDKVNPKNTPTKSPRFSKPKKSPFKPKKVSLIDEKCDWNGSVFPFKGTKQLIEHEEEKKHSDYEDEDWSPSNVKCNIKLNNALGALMGAYMSGDDSEDEIVVKDINNRQQISQLTNSAKQEKPGVSCVTEQVKPNIVPATEKSNHFPAADQTETVMVCDVSDDDSPPTEVKLVKDKKQDVVEDTPTVIVENNCVKEQTVSTRKRKRTNFKRRTNKRNSKVDTKKQQMPSQETNATQNSNTNFPYKFKKRKVTLLEKLLENEIRHERNVLLQCVRYVVSNNFFDKV